MSQNVKIAEVVAGTILFPDDAFDCMEFNVPLVVEKDIGRLYIPCSHGYHYLDGQESEDGKEFVGLSLKPWKIEGAL